jgi:lysophospholipase L1-like esterase
MKSTLSASKIALFLITITFFCCKEQLFDSPVVPEPTTAVLEPEPVTSAGPTVKWYDDVSPVVLPESNKKPVDASFRRGNNLPTIVILGSATAEGVGASIKSNRWVELMKAKLKADKKDVSIINLGVRTYTSYHIMPNGNKVTNRPYAHQDNNITKALSKKPFLVIIQLTTNDINNGYKDEETFKNYETLRRMLVEANVNYLFAGPQPRNFNTKQQRNRLLEFNEKLIAWDPNHVVDVLKKLSQQDFKIKKAYAYKDGRNINDKGHAVINGYMFNAQLFKDLLGYRTPKS